MKKTRYQKDQIYKKTEKLLYLYPRCMRANEMTDALEIIKGDPYFMIIAWHYFDGVTFEKIAEQTKKKKRTVYYHRDRLVQKLSEYLFADEISEKILKKISE